MKTVPLWVFLSTVIPLVLLMVGLCYVHFVRNPLPWPDYGNAGFILPDTKSRQALINVLREFGLSPDFRVDTPDVQRAIYRSQFPFILDVDSDEASTRVGHPGCFLAVTVADPAQSAVQAVDRLTGAGFRSEVIYDPDPGLSKGKLAVVRSQAFPGMMIVFRRHILKMGGKPPAWHDDK